MTKLLGNKKIPLQYIYALLILLLLVIFCVVFYRIKVYEPQGYRYFQHERSRDADPSIGPEEVNADFTVDAGTFETHLPLIILDMGGKEPEVIYTYKPEDESKIYKDPNVTDPFIGMSMKIIDTKDHHNTVSSEASFEGNGKIKLRGNSSLQFAKKQYGIKLLDDEGNELEESLLGMEPDEDWVLSNSLADASFIRTYLTYNIGGLLMPYTPDVRFCEVLVKKGDTYEYRGLYLLTESVKKAPGRVDIQTYEGNTNNLSYLVSRDRIDHTGITLSTYASDTQLCFGWFRLKYPSEKLADEETLKAIGDDLSKVEKVLYSEDDDVFLSYPRYIDVDSFVDYMVINEFFMNYDAGLHSTYYYKDKGHKLTMGPLWDYDGALDNYSSMPGSTQALVLPGYPWFEKLVRDPDFCKKVESRYKRLRETIFSDEFIEEFVNGTVAYLGNAAKRENSRWHEAYLERHSMKTGEVDGFIIDRRRDTYEEEIERLLDTELIHAHWLDETMGYILDANSDKKLSKNPYELYSIVALVMMATFLISVLMVTKLSKGEID